MARDSLLQKLGLKYPLIVAPMAGGPSTPELVAACSEKGALGSIGAAYSPAADILSFSGKVRERTSAPFAINLFVPQGNVNVTADQLQIAKKCTRKFRESLGLADPELNPPFEEDFERQFEAVLKIKPAVLSFIFGLLQPEYVRAARKENILLVGTATTPDEALALQDSDVDAITLQGFEAGGHRGIFDSKSPDAEIKTFELLQSCKAKIKIPLIAAGGIMNAAQIKEAIRQGATAVQMGTAFLAVKEAGTSAAYRKALLAPENRQTKTTRAFSGRLARGLENAFMAEIDRHPEAILPFPAQNKFTRDIRTASAKAGSSDCLSLWSGSGPGKLWTGSAAELIDELFL